MFKFIAAENNFIKKSDSEKKIVCPLQLYLYPTLIFSGNSDHSWEKYNRLPFSIARHWKGINRRDKQEEGEDRGVALWVAGKAKLYPAARLLAGSPPYFHLFYRNDFISYRNDFFFHFCQMMMESDNCFKIDFSKTVIVGSRYRQYRKSSFGDQSRIKPGELCTTVRFL